MTSYHTILSEYAKNLSDKYKMNISIRDNKVSVPLPESIEQAKETGKFWKDLFGFTDVDDTLEKIEFVYQEKDKEIPLSYTKNLIKKLGFNIKPKKETGKIKYDSVKPETISFYEGSARITTTQQEWKRLNEVSKNTETFSSPFIMLPENLCYRVNIPLECIIKSDFKFFK